MRVDGVLRGLWGWQMCGYVGKLGCWTGGDGDRFTEKREVLLR